MLETKRLILRPAVIEDAPNLFILNSDPDVVRYTGDRSFTSLMDAQDLIKNRMIAQFNQYKMSRFSCLLKDGTYIGWCGLKYHPETDEVDLGYRFMKKYWGQGYATESSSASLAYGFENLGLKRIIAKAMPDNLGSIKVIQKLGMTFRGYVNDPTDPHSFLLYDMTDKQYQTCKES
jgi:[ribosomal protein S5]-alanine N-acetyltransferase